MNVCSVTLFTKAEAPQSCILFLIIFLLNINDRLSPFIVSRTIALCVAATHPPNQFQWQKLHHLELLYLTPYQKMLLQFPNRVGSTCYILMRKKPFLYSAKKKSRCSPTLLSYKTINRSSRFSLVGVTNKKIELECP